MSKLSEPSEAPELNQRLGLYRVFLKLYEHHRELLDEILDLENSDSRYQTCGNWQFLQGVVQQQQAYLITNLHDKTQMLIQPQNRWIIGRDRNAGIPFPDKRLSRRHALVQYIANEGFYLLDLKSTNGSYVNGEPVRRPVLLRDGDRIRLGSLSFIFFLCKGVRQVEAIPVEVLRQLEAEPGAVAPKASELVDNLNEKVDEILDTPLAGNDRETFMFLNSANPLVEDKHDLALPELNSTQKAEILDRFLNRS